MNHQEDAVAVVAVGVTNPQTSDAYFWKDNNYEKDKKKSLHID